MFLSSLVLVFGGLFVVCCGMRYSEPGYDYVDYETGLIKEHCTAEIKEEKTESMHKYGSCIQYGKCKRDFMLISSGKQTPHIRFSVELCEKCPEGVRNTKECPLNRLVFDPDRNVCDLPKNVKKDVCGSDRDKKPEKEGPDGDENDNETTDENKTEEPTTEVSKIEEETTKPGELEEQTTEGEKIEEETTTESAKEGESEDGNEKCDAPENYHRLGKSNFYVFQNAERLKHVNWFGAKEICETAGFKLAKIDNIQTEVLVGRELEKWILSKAWIDNWYWIDAKFDRESKTYKWQDTKESLNFSNFFYRSTRPKGYGDFFDIHGNSVEEPKDEHCLAQSMPLSFPNLEDYQSGTNGNEGFRTGWWERLCNSKWKGNVLCESEEEACKKERELSIFTESVGSYYQEFWPMSNRRFIVSWTAQTFEEAKALCEDMNLEIYSPHEEDECLSANLKTWMPSVTTYAFWTDVEYSVNDKKFLHIDGTEVPESIQNTTTRVKRDAKNGIDKTCASISWNFEDFPKNPNFCNCTFNSLVLSPENCNNKIGVICQPKDKLKRKCTSEFFEKATSSQDGAENITTAEKPAKILEFYPFNDDSNWEPKSVMRSAYKQPGNSGQCLDGYKRLTQNETYWGKSEDFMTSVHKYDFLAPYWMKPENQTCFLSRVIFDKEAQTLTRELTEESCSTHLGFILCRKRPKNVSDED